MTTPARREPAGVVGIFSDEDAMARLVGAWLVEHNAEWAVQRGCCRMLERVTQWSDDPVVTLSSMAA